MEGRKCEINAAVLGGSRSYSEIEAEQYPTLRLPAARTKPCKSRRNKMNGSAVLHLAFEERNLCLFLQNAPSAKKVTRRSSWLGPLGPDYLEHTNTRCTNKGKIDE
jgi:hypothetical protein